MGQKIEKYYKYVEEKFSIAERMRVSMQTGIPSSKAFAVPDSAENIDKLKKSIAEVTKQPVPTF